MGSAWSWKVCACGCVPGMPLWCEGVRSGCHVARVVRSRAIHYVHITTVVLAEHLHKWEGGENAGGVGRARR